MRYVYEETHLHLIYFFLMYFLLMLHLQLCLHLFFNPEMPQNKRYDNHNQNKYKRACPPGFIPHRQYSYVECFGIVVPFSVIIGRTNLEAILSVRKIYIGNRTVRLHLSPVFVIPLKLV